MRIFNPIKMQSILPHYLSLLRLMFESSEVIRTWQDQRLLAGMIVLDHERIPKRASRTNPLFTCPGITQQAVSGHKSLTGASTY